MSDAAAKKPAGKAAPVPESVLKKRKTTTLTRVQAIAKARKLKKNIVERRKVIFKKAEKYVKEYRDIERSAIRLRRQARSTGDFYREPEAKLAFVIRIRGINGVDPRTKKILQLLRLRQFFNGVFVRLTTATINMLRLVEPYIAYGYPNLKSIKELVYKRGFAKVNGQRIAITNNLVIEKRLGKLGVVCIEDIIHELYTVGPNFKKVNKFLWPFKLSSPLGGLKKKTTHFVEGGDNGNREDFINALIRRMN